MIRLWKSKKQARELAKKASRNGFRDDS